MGGNAEEISLVRLQIERMTIKNTVGQLDSKNTYLSLIEVYERFVDEDKDKAV